MFFLQEHGISRELITESSEPQVVWESESEEVEAGEVILTLPLPFIHLPNHNHYHCFLDHQLLALPFIYVTHQVSCSTLIPECASKGCCAYQSHLKKSNDSNRRKDHRESRLRSRTSCSIPQETRNACVPGTRCHRKERCYRDISGNELFPSLPVISQDHPVSEGQLTGGSDSEVCM